MCLFTFHKQVILNMSRHMIMKKILVVEDVQTLRRDIVEMLSYEGYDVEGAENGLVGVERARQYQPDLIICDIMMPGLDGFGVLETLRKDRSTAKIPFIFLTARTERPDERKGMELGADDYLTKPFTATELIKTVEARLVQDDIVDDYYSKKLKDLRNNIVLALPHELRTPLNVILGFSDLLMNDAAMLDSERVADMARYINTSGWRLFRLIENYLLFTQLEVNSANADSEQILRKGSSSSVHGIIRDQAERTARDPHPPTDPRIEHLQLDLQPLDELPIAEEHLKKIIEELVDNACKFSANETPVAIKGKVQEGYYILTVTDLGVGMKPEEIASIDAYMQFERGKREQQGTGLGLVIVRQLARMYGGSMSLASEVGKGTTVTVKLPLKAKV
jgi:signal transduction histidine kinase